GARRERRAPVAPELERDASDLVAALGQQRRRYARVHPAAHRSEHSRHAPLAPAAAAAPRTPRTLSPSATITRSTSSALAPRHAEAHDSRQVLGPAAAPALVRAAAEERLARGPVAQDRGADPLRTPQLVGRDYERINTQRAEVHRDLSRRLHRVALDRKARRV